MTNGQHAVALGIATMGLFGTLPGCSPVAAAFLGLIVAALTYGTSETDG